MSTSTAAAPAGPRDVFGHPRQLWMLFMTEFWERFSFYGMRWALTLYIVAQFFAGDQSGQAYASRTYGSFLALVYATSIFGGYAADRLIGYQRSILLGAIITAAGLFMITIPNQEIFLMGLAVVITGNGLFKPNISTMVGQLYKPDDARRDSGFTIFYMGINAGALVAPIATGWLASTLTHTPLEQNYKAVFIATGIGMLVSFLWFWFGRRDLGEIGRPPQGAGMGKMLMVLVGALVCAPVIYVLLNLGGGTYGTISALSFTQVIGGPLQALLGSLFVVVALLMIIEGFREGKVQRDKVFAMVALFIFNMFFWCFFEQAGSSLNFLAENIVNRNFGGWEFPVGWFQSINPIAIVILAPIVTIIWGALNRAKAEPSIPRKFGLGLILNGLSFTVLMFALSSLVSNGHIPLWPLALTYVVQTLGELCLSPIGLSMVTKLAPLRSVGMAMGGWFLSISVGNNLSGIVAASMSGESGLTVPSALHGFTFSFEVLMGAGVLLFLIAPLITKLMHGIK
jgi:POT family proton-dependent oligopeptide transporter